MTGAIIGLLPNARVNVIVSGAIPDEWLTVLVCGRKSKQRGSTPPVANTEE